ncbi:MAG: hypothetical protein Q8R55_05885 [Candidatus Taylorbacteria bacterium]|nr:hypothetical protein [Candidatus Taylorbacteria bacterium]
MRLTIKEKAGLIDTSRIYEGIHLANDFIKRAAIDLENIAPELKEEGDKHFGICEKCRNKKDSFLPFNETNE